VHWFLLRRARRHAATRRHSATVGSHLRTRITVALRLLAWLDEHDLPLGRLDQASLDAWLACGNTSRYPVRYFLGWAAARGLAPRLTVPSLPPQDPAQVLDETQRWALLRRCLAEEAMPLDTRAAAALVLLFGLPLSRIRHLTVEQLDLRGTRGFFTVGRHPLLLPPRLADLLRRLADTSRSRASLADGQAARRWLLASMPDQPATPRSSAWRATFRPRSWPTCSACTPAPPSIGPRWPSATGRLPRRADRRHGKRGSRGGLRTRTGMKGRTC